MNLRVTAGQPLTGVVVVAQAEKSYVVPGVTVTDSCHKYKLGSVAPFTIIMFVPLCAANEPNAPFQL